MRNLWTALIADNLWTALIADLVAISILAYFVYFRRYYRRDLLLAYIALNVGVLVVTTLLASAGAATGLGLGFGLFGILSIVRLRSDSITQEEVAYYFISLALGLINGLHTGRVWFTPALSATLLAVMYVADHPRLLVRTRRQTVTLDAAYPDPGRLYAVLEQLLAGKVKHCVVRELDLVRDITVVDVRFRLFDRRTAPTYVARQLDRVAP
ncbi:DUF4956 domain-containing protein [Actinopolymorpha rutila]|uniref:Putative small integral membrane protein n=1 Tax=Actinopolymorpha rutila TaxID=446787 RepID=A0A852ZLH0_9ACTN|nr:DUF4956 domain-containing protein [Actinopolymorpha rutila]NYH93083.1 putative small integral membrane protein [Actinopolymorpha rutila]